MSVDSSMPSYDITTSPGLPKSCYGLLSIHVFISIVYRGTWQTNISSRTNSLFWFLEEAVSICNKEHA